MAARELTAVDDVVALELVGIEGERHSVASLAGETATVLLFIGGGCPTARAYEERLRALQGTWRDRGVRLIAVNSNNPHLSPPDTLEAMRRRAPEQRFNFPYLKDEDAALARYFGAVCTPHAFLLDSQLRVVYSGRIDDSRLGNKITHRELGEAIAAVVAGREVDVPRTEPFGCAIVW